MTVLPSPCRHCHHVLRAGATLALRPEDTPVGTMAVCGRRLVFALGPEELEDEFHDVSTDPRVDRREWAAQVEKPNTSVD